MYDGIGLFNSGVAKEISPDKLVGMKIKSAELVPCTDELGNKYDDEPYLKL